MKYLQSLFLTTVPSIRLRWDHFDPEPRDAAKTLQRLPFWGNPEYG